MPHGQGAKFDTPGFTHGHFSPHCAPILPFPPPPLPVKPMFTDRYTVRDFCQLVEIPAGTSVTVAIPNDPNTTTRAAWVAFTSMGGDYAVSVTGAPDFTNTGTNTPIVNVEKLNLTDVSDLRIWAKETTKVKVCWYRAEPINTPVENGGCCSVPTLDKIYELLKLMKDEAAAKADEQAALLRTVIVELQGIDANTDGLEAEIATVILRLEDGNALSQEQVVRLNAVIAELQKLDANTDNVEALLTLVVGNTDEIEPLLNSVILLLTTIRDNADNVEPLLVDIKGNTDEIEPKLDAIIAKLQGVNPGVLYPQIQSENGAFTVPAGKKFISIASKDRSDYIINGVTIPGCTSMTFPSLTSGTYASLSGSGNVLIQTAG